MFKPSSHFLSALSLYKFDQDLRSLAFGEIAKIEVAIRSAIANIVARISDKNLGKSSSHGLFRQFPISVSSSIFAS